MAHLIGVVGGLGAGKTTFASFYPWLLKNTVELRGGNIELFANYELFGAHMMQDPEDWYRVAEAHGSICVWDEAHVTFDSRKFNQAQNIFATELLTYVRKMASIQIFATPSINRLDTRIRELIEILIVARKVGNGTYYDYYDFQSDFAGRYGRYLHSKFLPRHKMRQIHSLNLFDSYNFVTRFPLPRTERQQEQFMVELNKAHQRGLDRWRKGIKHETIVAG